MNLEKVLVYVTHNSESIIQWTFLAILLLAIALIGMMVFFGKGQEAGATAGAGAGVGAGAAGTLNLTLAGGEGAASAGDLQTMLTKLLEQTAALQSVPSGQMTPAVAADVDQQVQKMKAELAARESEIAQLKAAGPSQTGADADKLNARIKELEAKLAEYEILEDDIADLSLYKEENVRLRSELDKLKTEGGVAPAVAEDAAPVAATPEMAAAAEPAPIKAEPIAPEALSGAIDDLLGQADAAAAAATTAEAANPNDMLADFAMNVTETPAPAEPAKTIQVPDTGNPMADFESTVQIEKKMKADPLAEPELKPIAPTATPGPAESTAAAPASNEADDLFAEFSEAPAETADRAEASTLDTSKMMEEMAALVSMEPTDKSSLEESIDFDKMASEASHNKS